jgi:hypothetical protein
VSFEQAWLKDHAKKMKMPDAWRGILTEYYTASLKLVSDSAELDVLELLLADSAAQQSTFKAPLGEDRHPQLLAPFNFRPRHASRFRAANQPGYWYGASTLDASLSEVAYWRMVFISASTGCSQLEIVTDHSFFQTDVDGMGVDLMSPPWNINRSIWRHGSDYSSTQALAVAAEKAKIQWILYESVRAPNSPLAVVFDPEALKGTTSKVNASCHEWTCKATRERVVIVNKKTGETKDWTSGGDQ